MKKWISLLLAVMMTLSLAACAGKTQSEDPVVQDAAVFHETEFGGVYIDRTIDDFNAQGFAYGDSVTVTFSNGYTVENIPYYNGYYTQTGEPLLVAYPGYPYIKVCINNGDDLWELAGLSEDDTAVVTRNERGKYLDIQNARDIHYTDAREDYTSDIVFANFRSVQAGDIQSGMLCRAASPCDNQHNRATYVDALIETAGVQYIVNLADNEEKIAGYLADSSFVTPYFQSLYEAGKVIPVALTMNFGSEDFRAKIVTGLTAMAEHPGPYLVHCTEGKDRTGFVCMLLEALCGASYDEIVADYMITYDNYYGITKASDPARYDVIVENLLIPMLRTVVGDETADLTTADLAACAERYLTDAGMGIEQITALRTQLTGG